MEEEWRDVIGFEGHYQVSNKGNVRSITRTIVFKTGAKRIFEGCILKYRINRGGYPQVILQKGRKRKTTPIHRLVATAFLSNPENKLTVNHIDGNKLNNSVKNLEWATRSENCLHRDYVLKKRITPVWKCDLSGNPISRYESIKEAAKKLGCKASCISNAIHGRAKIIRGYKWKAAEKEV